MALSTRALLTSSRLIVVSPHLDDALLSMGGVLAQAQTAEKWVVNVFTGAPDPPQKTRHDNASRLADSTEAMGTRLLEDAAALTLYNVTGINLGFIDGQYAPKQPRNAHLRATLLRVILSLSAHTNATVFGPANFGVFSHSDHLQVHHILRGLARRIPRLRLCFYSDFPYVQRYLQSAPQYTKRRLVNDQFEKTLQVRVPVNPAAWAMRKRALLKYKSQLAAFKSSGREFINWNTHVLHQYCGSRNNCEVYYCSR
jgi:LmbE family N-acetylglucosaminyl deacetylase